MIASNSDESGQCPFDIRLVAHLTREERIAYVYHRVIQWTWTTRSKSANQQSYKSKFMIRPCRTVNLIQKCTPRTKAHKSSAQFHHDRVLSSTWVLPLSSSFVTSDQSSNFTAPSLAKRTSLLNPSRRSSGAQTGYPSEPDLFTSPATGRLLRRTFRQRKSAGKVGVQADRMARQTSTIPQTQASTSDPGVLLVLQLQMQMSAREYLTGGI